MSARWKCRYFAHNKAALAALLVCTEQNVLALPLRVGHHYAHH